MRARHWWYDDRAPVCVANKTPSGINYVIHGDKNAAVCAIFLQGVAASLTVLKLFCDRLDDAVDRLLLAPSPCVVDGRLDLAMNSTEREARAARTRLAFENARLARARERADKAARSRDGVLAKLEKRPPKRRRGRGGPLKGF